MPADRRGQGKSGESGGRDPPPPCGKSSTIGTSRSQIEALVLVAPGVGARCDYAAPGARGQSSLRARPTEPYPGDAGRRCKENTTNREVPRARSEERRVGKE